MGRFAASAYLVAGLGMIALHFSLGGSIGVYDAVGLTSVGAVLIGTAYYRPANWRGWMLIAFAQALFAAGDFVYHEFPPTSFPGVPDALYLASYAVFVPALLLLMGRSFPWRDVGGHVNALLVTVALGVSCWLVFVDRSFPVSLHLASLVSLAYPVADLVCVGLLVRVALAPGSRAVSFWLLFASLLPLFVADGSYVLPAVSTTYRIGTWPDAGWLGAYVLLGAAALHPSLAKVCSIGPARQSAPMRRVLLVGAAIITLPVSAIIEHLVRGGVDVLLVSVAGTVLLAGAVLRAAILVRQLDGMRLRAEESERRFRMVFERAPIGISVGRDGIMSETNPALQRMLGYDGGELARMHYTDVTHPDDRDLAAQRELDRGERDAFTIEKQYVRKDGSSVETRVHVVLDLDDGLGMSMIEDVTDRHHLERQLRDAQKMEAVGKLAGGIAHDFNNLMTAVIGYSDLLLQKSDRDTKEKLEAIRESAVRASDLTRQLLAFGRRQMLRENELDLRDVVRQAEELLRTVVGGRVRVETHLGPDPVRVRADRSQIERVLVNLAENAATAMPAGGVLTIGVSSDGGEAVLTVADEGTGMDDQTQARIFEPYFTTKPFSEASGLGLATVHGIVGQSGGTIAVATAPGAGSVFTIRLPEAARASLRPGAAAATLVD